MAIDPGRGWIVLGAEIAAGDTILFCRRDPESARRDMVRMVRPTRRSAHGPAKAGLYVSCVARGAALFATLGRDRAHPREFGRIPVDRFFANGEISRDPALWPHWRSHSLHLKSSDWSVRGQMACCVSSSESAFRRSSSCGCRCCAPGSRGQSGWIRANFHLTLRFIGEIARTPPPISTTLCHGCEYADSHCRSQGTGVFGGGDRPRSLWVGVERTAELVALRDKVEQALFRAGLPPEPRKFAPTLPLRGCATRRWTSCAIISRRTRNSVPKPLPVEGFSLIASFQTKAGSVYEEQADYPLLALTG